MKYYNIDVANYNDEIQLTLYFNPVSYDYGKREDNYNDDNEIRKFIDEFTQQSTKARKQRFEVDNEISKVNVEENKFRSLRRSKQMLYEYSRANVWQYFITWTIADEKIRFDYQKCTKKFRKWLNNLKARKINDLEYVVVPERHKDGAWHFHSLVSGNLQPYLITNEYGHLDFNFKKLGFVNIQVVKDTYKVSNYIIKYITKTLDDEFVNSQRYFVSKGLKKAEHTKQFVNIATTNFAPITDNLHHQQYFDGEWESECYKDLFHYISTNFPDYQITHSKTLSKPSGLYGDNYNIQYIQLKKFV